jgi:hypothetical protein
MFPTPRKAFRLSLSEESLRAVYSLTAAAYCDMAGSK